MNLNTYFYDEKHEKVASIPGMVSLVKGTVVALREGGYEVKDVELHLNNHDSYNPEDLGFRVFLRKLP